MQRLHHFKMQRTLRAPSSQRPECAGGATGHPRTAMFGGGNGMWQYCKCGGFEGMGEAIKAEGPAEPRLFSNAADIRAATNGG